MNVVGLGAVRRREEAADQTVSIRTIDSAQAGLKRTVVLEERAKVCSERWSARRSEEGDQPAAAARLTSCSLNQPRMCDWRHKHRPGQPVSSVRGRGELRAHAPASSSS